MVCLWFVGIVSVGLICCSYFGVVFFNDIGFGSVIVVVYEIVYMLVK